MRTANPSEPPAQPYRHAYAMILRNTTTVNSTVRYSRLFFIFIAIICILYFYLTGVGVVPSLAATAAMPLTVYPFCRRLALLTTTTSSLSNQVRYLTNRQGLLYPYIPPFTALTLCKLFNCTLYARLFLLQQYHIMRYLLSTFT